VRGLELAPGKWIAALDGLPRLDAGAAPGGAHRVAAGEVEEPEPYADTVLAAGGASGPHAGERDFARPGPAEV